VDLFLATTIGYGNMGWLTTIYVTMPRRRSDARSYYMMQQAQQQYAFIRPKTIEYAGPDGKMFTPSQAHANGVIAQSRIHVEYENGTHVYVNRGKEGVLTVKTVDLPVNGWLVFNAKTGFHEISANVSGRRIDHVKAPEFEFLDGRGQWTERGSLGATGSVARRNRAPGVVEMIDIYGNDRISFQADGAGQLMAYDPEGKSLGKVETSPRRLARIQANPTAMYVFAKWD
jgi:hypothetical protein